MPFDFPKMEEEILAQWESKKVFEQSLQKEAPAGSFVFFEGPPTANGKPGIHHVEARAFKDLFPRYKTMRGFRVDRKAGWDTHGLPVELGVEKALGISGKPQIESLKATPSESIAFFNAECKKSVWSYLEEWQKMTRRIGFWLDMDAPYVTYHTEYMESLWAIIKRVQEKGLLYRDYRIVPFCTRCGTALSSHEVAQGYATVKDNAVTVAFTLMEDPTTAVLAWTTTPWTLPGNVGLAINPNIAYVKVASISFPGKNFILAKERVAALTQEDQTAPMTAVDATELIGKKYLPLFDFVNLAKEHDGRCYEIVAADFVTTEDGTGVVHTAVMYGEEDFALGAQVGFPKIHTVTQEGLFNELVPTWEGMYVKDAKTEKTILAYLQEQGRLYGTAPYEHEYPFCWRCSSPLLYYAKESWWIRMSSLREKLLAANDTINWEPSYIKEGRFGEWLRGVKDWAFSRERYWGTPLPLWICDGCGAQECMGSVKELETRAGKLPMNNGEVDLHRPYVDDITFGCSSCSGTMTRTKEVIDVWFDSGAMPFAQWGWPNTAGSEEKVAASYPADFISEAIDQTRGWFYTLLAVATLLDKEAPYKHVISLGHLLDKNGQKMSKSKGNVVDPWAMIEKYGADCVRLFMYTVNQPGDSVRFDEKELGELQRSYFFILWNVLTFSETYADKNTVAKFGETHVLDLWLHARTNQLVETVTNGLEKFQVTESSRALGAYVTDLSTWYVRRSRDRFKSDDAQDAADARATLLAALYTFSLVMAPFCPFTAEALYARVGGEKESVHLDAWPLVEKMDATVLTDMELARTIVSRGLEARTEAKMNVRQPLAKAIITGATLSDALVDVIKDELNVHEITQSGDGQLTVTLDTQLSDELKTEGAVREVVRQLQALRKNTGLRVGEKIAVSWILTGPLTDTLKEKSSEIAKAVTAEKINEEKKDLEHSATLTVHETTIWVGIEKV